MRRREVEKGLGEEAVVCFGRSKRERERERGVKVQVEVHIF